VAAGAAGGGDVTNGDAVDDWSNATAGAAKSGADATGVVVTRRTTGGGTNTAAVFNAAVVTAWKVASNVALIWPAVMLGRVRPNGVRG
jgi:hypothetical protein